MPQQAAAQSPPRVTEASHIDPDQLSPTARRLFGMMEFDGNERLICEIRKHPFGLFAIYFAGFFVSAVVLAICIAVSSFLSANSAQTGIDVNQMRSLLALVGITVSGLAAIITLIGAFIYRSNVILVTNEKIAQVVYSNIIDRKISQLSIGDIQDVTVSQNGLFARIFNFGTLVIETSGEQQNYTFSYVPMPYKSAKSIVNAHEENLKQFGN